MQYYVDCEACGQLHTWHDGEPRISRCLRCGAPLWPDKAPTVRYAVWVERQMPDGARDAFTAYIVGVDGNRGLWLARDEDAPPDQWLYYRDDDESVKITPSLNITPAA